MICSYGLFIQARLAQRLEHRTCNAMVIGSIPIAGSLLFPSFLLMIYNVLLGSRNMRKIPLSSDRWFTGPLCHDHFQLETEWVIEWSRSI